MRQLLVAILLVATPAVAARPTVRTFDSPAAALSSLLPLGPRVLGIGEYHEIEGAVAGGVKIRSAIARFTDELLPLLIPTSSDLILETWVKEGRCGKKEKEVVAKVETDTRRPETTESEIVTLIKKAQAAEVKPHILVMSCIQYLYLSDGKGGVDYVKLLATITDLLKDKIDETVKARDHEKPRPKTPRTVLVYGGALHNDVFPRAELADYSYVKPVRKIAKGKYVELDLYVPEYIDKDEEITAQPWYALLASVAKGKTALVKRSADSYILVFPRTEAAAAPPAPAPVDKPVAPTSTPDAGTAPDLGPSR